MYKFLIENEGRWECSNILAIYDTALKFYSVFESKNFNSGAEVVEIETDGKEDGHLNLNFQYAALSCKMLAIRTLDDHFIKRVCQGTNPSLF